MALLDKIGTLLSANPAIIVVEQFRVLALRLYPYLIVDFYHKADVAAAFASVYVELEQIKTILRTHVHPVSPPTIPGAPQVAAPIPILVLPTMPTVIPGEAVALSLLVAPGVPQPISGGISIQPSRIDPMPILIPPISPMDTLETFL